MYGDAKECMDDKLSVQRVLILFPKKKFKWHFIIQMSFIDYGWAWITCNTKSHGTSIGIRIKHGYLT
jgi:hypothetical protein